MNPKNETASIKFYFCLSFHTKLARQSCYALAVVPWLMIGCNEPTNVMKAYHGEAFLFYYPSDLSIVKESPVEDFQLLKVKRNKDVIMTIYVGNQPDFPSTDFRDAIEQKALVNGCEVRSLTQVRKDGSNDREALLELSSSNSWPQYLHFSYASLNAEISQIADAIIESARNDT